MAEGGRFETLEEQEARARTSASAAADDLAAGLSSEVGPARGGVDAVAAGRGPARRDAHGRFSRPRARRAPPCRPVRGRRGPSYLAGKTQPALVRLCVELEHRVGRLESEMEEREWRDPTVEGPARMVGIRRLQRDGQARRLEALDEVLIEMSVERLPADMPGRHEEIARRVTGRLGTNFHWRTLYTAAFRSRWLATAQFLDEHPADASALSADRSRWTKPFLTYRIGRLMRRRDELLTSLSERLRARSVEEEGWEPIRRR